ncbi:hypothetical protein EGW08_015639 [Elysia chlorotica]|uniref:DDE-1 domain-containing protein n=1 Tax=Elysia chlorotica TaxID=188477 RepID=A0A433T4W9_ELYCH|nr:hypothetical protein EGW08_015639 [Elysia chlorotica]
MWCTTSMENGEKSRITRKHLGMAKNQHNPKWSKEQLASALEEVCNGAPKRKTAEKYGIPWGTFSDKLSGRRKLEEKPKTVLSKEEEEEIVNFLKEMSARGFGKTKDELLKRHEEIVFRKPQLLGKQRALVSKKDILDWFSTFSQAIKDIDASILLEPDRIYNCDESGFSLNALSGRVLSYLDNKFVYQVCFFVKTLITALVCCSATGYYTWPMLIYPGTQFRGFKPHEVFEESFIGRSKNGWINQDLFFEWLKLVFVPQTAHVKKPLLLLLDGHVSHQSLQTSTLCAENQIVLYCLPPHSSHILQPLDVGVFKTMKAEWKLAVKRQNETEIVTKRTFAKTFKDAYERTVAKPLCGKAFKACGLYPLDPSSIEWSKVLPSSNDHPDNPPPTAQAQASVVEITSPPPTACSTPERPMPSERPVPSVIAEHPADSTSGSSSSHCRPPAANPIPTIAAPGAQSQLEAAKAPGTTTTVSSWGAASSSNAPDGYRDPGSTLRKFAMICSQIGEATLHEYYRRMEEDYDIDEPLFVLWRSYHTELVSPMAVTLTESSNLASASNESATEKHPLAIPTVKKGANRFKKSLKLPPLISSPDFRKILVQKDKDEKAEEERKRQRKIDMEEKRKTKAMEEEIKKAKKEQTKKEREEKKRQKELEVQLRKEDRKRKLEERNKNKAESQKKAKKQKVSRRLYNKAGSESDTSVDESTMVLDDNSSDEYEVDQGCESDESTVHIENRSEETTAKDAETDKFADAERTETEADETVLCMNDSLASLSEYVAVTPKTQGQLINETAHERNLWLDLAVESIDSISPSLHTINQ